MRGEGNIPMGLHVAHRSRHFSQPRTFYSQNSGWRWAGLGFVNPVGRNKLVLSGMNILDG